MVGKNEPDMKTDLLGHFQYVEKNCISTIYGQTLCLSDTWEVKNSDFTQKY